ncbi:uncharacterized protein LOC127106722 [Lathyrus oleraceus]|uniref:Neprosin PEP catalytic domain-containing protein n=1 Tax=Pisum sativum TaxID=3888 RepID=A0A9D4VH09_PEA|nr:uncharacterized protein LOC127106722 [Pisum sativum]KAI5382606.1 hypothetical protein KIW84_070155 [Pisum sativum]
MTLFLVVVLSFCIARSNVDARIGTLSNETSYFTTSDIVRHDVDIDFDCIDIHKQPSLNHPLLKNHKIQLYPTFTRNIVPIRPSYDGKIIERCPIGKVPIHRKTKRHQIEGFQSNSHEYHSISLDTNQTMTFHGGYAYVGGYNLQLTGKQYSLSGIWVESGPPSNLNSIFVGHGVMPNLYGDSQLHITTRWAAGGSGCYNIHCYGFVQVKSDPYLGMVLSPTSIIGSFHKLALCTTIKQDKVTGHWWLCIHPKPVCFGYWPKELFSHLRSGASIIRYGGETYTPPGMVSPPMGSGRLPQEKYKNSGFMERVEIINSEYNQIDINPRSMKINKNVNLSCYDLLYRGFEGGSARHSFLYGGPGGRSC